MAARTPHGRGLAGDNDDDWEDDQDQLELEEDAEKERVRESPDDFYEYPPTSDRQVLSHWADSVFDDHTHAPAAPLGGGDMPTTLPPPLRRELYADFIRDLDGKIRNQFGKGHQEAITEVSAQGW